MDFLKDLQRQLDEFEGQDQLRRCLTIASAQGPVVTMGYGSEKSFFAVTTT